MDWLFCFLFLYLFLILHCNAQTTSYVQSNSPTITAAQVYTSTLTTCDAFTSCTTSNVATQGTNINVGGSTSSVTVAGSAITIGAPAGAFPTAMPTVSINGINPITSWSQFFTTSSASTIAASSGTAGPAKTITWSTTNTNDRATPTLSSRLINCPTPSPAPTPTSVTVTGTTDCLAFPLAGYWEVDFEVSMTGVNSPSPVPFYATAFIATAPTASPVPSTLDIDRTRCIGVYTNSPAVEYTAIRGRKVLKIPTAYPSPAGIAAVAFAGTHPTTPTLPAFGCNTATSGTNCILNTRYLGPL